MWLLRRDPPRRRAAPPTLGATPPRSTAVRPPERSHLRLPARTLRHAREAADAVKAAGLLRGPMTPERARDLIALLDPYRRRVFLPVGPNPMHGLVGLPAGRLHEMTLRHVAPVLLDVLLPACREHLTDRLVGRLRPTASAGDGQGEPANGIDGLPGVIDVATAMRTVLGALRGGGRQHALAVVAAIEHDSRTMARAVARSDAPLGRPGGVWSD